MNKQFYFGIFICIFFQTSESKKKRRTKNEILGPGHRLRMYVLTIRFIQTIRIEWK